MYSTKAPNTFHTGPVLLTPLWDLDACLGRHLRWIPRVCGKHINILEGANRGSPLKFDPLWFYYTYFKFFKRFFGVFHFKNVDWKQSFGYLKVYQVYYIQVMKICMTSISLKKKVLTRQARNDNKANVIIHASTQMRSHSSLQQDWCHILALQGLASSNLL